MLSRLGDLAAARPRRSLLAILAFFLVAAVLGGPVVGLLNGEGGFQPPNSESERTTERLEAATGTEASPGIVMLVSTPDGATAAKSRVAELEQALSARPGIASVASFASTGANAFNSRDGRSTFLAATLRADADDDRVASDVTARFGDERDVALGGALIADLQINEGVESGLATAELLAFPFLLILSLLFFRGRATLLPLVVGIVTVFGTFLVVRAVNQVYGVGVFALNLVTGLGLGLAIDYSLFLITRYREELARTGEGPEAIRATMTSAGRTVLFSAATVAVALSTLIIFPLGFLKSMGIAGASVAVVAALAAVTIAPALMGLWGAKLAVKPRRGARARRPTPWSSVARLVTRRPGVVAVVAAVIMVVVALPALQAKWTPVDSTAIPSGTSAKTVTRALETDFVNSGTEPITIALAASAGDRAGVARYAAGLKGLPGVEAVMPPVSLDNSTWQINVPVRGDAASQDAQDLVETIRARPGGDALVGGAAAAFIDQQAGIGSRLVVAGVLLALLTYTILWLMTGSVILPLASILLNCLSVAAALGVVKLVFQEGRFTDLLGYTPSGGIEGTNFLVAAAATFAISTDYGLFLLGRIREAYDAGMSPREAVADGLERTGAVITAAAILLAVAIGAFMTSSVSFIQQLGLATAAGVLLDAFVVRSLLVPALVSLLGEWSWWSPAPLRRLHGRVGLKEGPSAAPAPVSVPA